MKGQVMETREELLRQLVIDIEVLRVLVAEDKKQEEAAKRAREAACASNPAPEAL